jgi:hypothetical protein
VAKFAAGVINTGGGPFSQSPRNLEKIRNKPTFLGAWGKMIHEKT